MLGIASNAWSKFATVFYCTHGGVPTLILLVNLQVANSTSAQAYLLRRGGDVR